MPGLRAGANLAQCVEPSILGKKCSFTRQKCSSNSNTTAKHHRTNRCDTSAPRIKSCSLPGQHLLLVHVLQLHVAIAQSPLARMCCYWQIRVFVAKRSVCIIASQFRTFQSSNGHRICRHHITWSMFEDNSITACRRGQERPRLDCAYFAATRVCGT